MKPYLTQRLAEFRKALKRRDLDAFVVADRHNTYYLTDFRCSYSLLVIDGRGVRFVTDARYAEMAEKDLPGFEIIVQPTTKVLEFIRDFFKKSGYGKIGFEESISVAEFDRLKKQTRGSNLVKAGEIPQKLRAVKDAEELRRIRRAVKIGDDLMADTIASLRTGQSELEISRRIRVRCEELGAEGESFDNIVASGANSSRPHHHPMKRKLRANDPITIDLGVRASGYCSDLTRTPVLGKASKRFAEIYGVCLEANQAAIRAIKPGMTGAEVDAIARDIIATAGYGDYFGHGLGHGVGVEIHEEPRLSQRAIDDKLEVGNIVTVEPGIYIPGFAGVRIEDYVLLTEKGASVLSKAPRELQELPLK